MKKLLSILLIPLVFSCGGNGNSAADLKKYEETKEKLAKRETENPLQFLQVIAEKNKNLIGQTVVKGVVENKATVASYRDIRLKILYYKQATLVENHEEEYNAIIPPNNKMQFKAKYFTPKGTDSIAVLVMKAKVADWQPFISLPENVCFFVYSVLFFFSLFSVDHYCVFAGSHTPYEAYCRMWNAAQIGQSVVYLQKCHGKTNPEQNLDGCNAAGFTYVFNGTGNWSNAGNWALGYRPSNPLPHGSKVLIDHAPGGNCLLDVPFDLTEGVNLEIAPGKQFIIPPKAN